MDGRRECIFVPSGFRAEIEILSIDKMDFSKKDVAGVIFQYPDTTGQISDPSQFVARAKEHGVRTRLSFSSGLGSSF